MRNSESGISPTVLVIHSPISGTVENKKTGTVEKKKKKKSYLTLL